MALPPYKDKVWLYEHYIKRRMKLLDIKKLLKDRYNIEVSHQTIFNYIQKYDLDIMRKGKRRVISSNLGKNVKKKPSPFHDAQKRQRAIMAQRRKAKPQRPKS